MPDLDIDLDHIKEIEKNKIAPRLWIDYYCLKKIWRERERGRERQRERERER